MLVQLADKAIYHYLDVVMLLGVALPLTMLLIVKRSVSLAKRTT